MAKQHIYKDNWIIEFTPSCFHAFILNMDDDVEDKTFLYSTPEFQTGGARF